MSSSSWSGTGSTKVEVGGHGQETTIKIRLLRNAAQRTPLQRLDCAGLLPQDRGRVRHRKVGDDAQQHDRTLVFREPIDGFAGGAPMPSCSTSPSTGSGAISPASESACGIHRVFTAPRSSAMSVHRPPMGDGEEPAPERRRHHLRSRRAIAPGRRRPRPCVLGSGTRSARRYPRTEGANSSYSGPNAARSPACAAATSDSTRSRSLHRRRRPPSVRPFRVDRPTESNRVEGDTGMPVSAGSRGAGRRSPPSRAVTDPPRAALHDPSWSRPAERVRPTRAHGSGRMR